MSPCLARIMASCSSDADIAAFRARTSPPCWGVDFGPIESTVGAGVCAWSTKGYDMSAASPTAETAIASLLIIAPPSLWLHSGTTLPDIAAAVEQKD